MKKTMTGGLAGLTILVAGAAFSETSTLQTDGAFDSPGTFIALTAFDAQQGTFNGSAIWTEETLASMLIDGNNGAWVGEGDKAEMATLQRFLMDGERGAGFEEVTVSWTIDPGQQTMTNGANADVIFQASISGTMQTDGAYLQATLNIDVDGAASDATTPDALNADLVAVTKLPVPDAAATFQSVDVIAANMTGAGADFAIAFDSGGAA